MTDDILSGQEIPAEEQEKLKEKIIDLDDEKLKFYEDLRRKAKNWTSQKGGKLGGKLGEYLFLLPDFFILVSRLALDKRVPSKQKLMVGGIIAYLIMPIDIIPDFIPVLGQLDDLIAVLLVLDGIVNRLDQKIVEEHWRGDPATLRRLQKLSARLTFFIPSMIKNKLFQRRMARAAAKIAQRALPDKTGSNHTQA